MDQAAGLRSLLARDSLRVLPLVGVLPRDVQAGLAVRLATALADSGRRVVLLDTSGDACRALGCRPQFDLLDLLRGKRYYEDVAVEASGGLRVLSAARGIALLADAGDDDWNELFLAFGRLTDPPEVVVLACASGDAMPACRVARAGGHEVILALEERAASVTRAYGLLKDATRRHNQRRYALLFAQTPPSFEARPVAARIGATAQRFAGAEVRLAGALAQDAAAADLMAASDHWSLPEFPLQLQ